MVDHGYELCISHVAPEHPHADGGAGGTMRSSSKSFSDQGLWSNTWRGLGRGSLGTAGCRAWNTWNTCKRLDKKNGPVGMVSSHRISAVRWPKSLSFTAVFFQQWLCCRFCVRTTAHWPVCSSLLTHWYSINDGDLVFWLFVDRYSIVRFKVAKFARAAMKCQLSAQDLSWWHPGSKWKKPILWQPKDGQL